MARYELDSKQVQNLQAIVLDANIKGSMAEAVAELLKCLDSPVDESVNNDLHSEHQDRKEPGDTAP